MTRPSIQSQLALARTPHRWPSWPQLPMRRSIGSAEPEYGRLYNISKGDRVEPMVYVGLPVDPIDITRVIYYQTLEGIFQDGWEII